MTHSKLNLVSSLVLAVVVGTTGLSWADEVVKVHKDVTYTHDSKGWYDENHTRHDFVVYKGHHGYWNYAHGQRVWVTVNL